MARDRASLDIQLDRARDVLLSLGLSSKPVACRETLEEIMNIWTRLLVYSAGKSRAAVHAAGLSTGGELITFAWLLMAHNKLGDVGQRYAFFVEDASTMAPPPPPPPQRLNTFKGEFALNLAQFPYIWDKK
jgi:hypothetical protein